MTRDESEAYARGYRLVGSPWSSAWAVWRGNLLLDIKPTKAQARAFLRKAAAADEMVRIAGKPRELEQPEGVR